MAQRGQGGAGTRQMRGFGMGRQVGGGMMAVYRKDVQVELGLTSDQKTKLDELRTQFRPQRGTAGAGQTPDLETLKAQVAERTKKIEAILTADQVKRLHEVELQLAGDRAILQEKVQKDLGLTASQTAKIKTLQAKFQEASASVREKMVNGEIDRDSMMASMQKNNTALVDELKKVLTAEQAAKLKEMGGKTFTPDPNETAGFGFGGRNGGGRRGNRGGGAGG